jgi:deoxycytidylate deaminase
MNKFDEPMMKTAEVWAEMSKCLRNQVGAVIAIDSNIITVGYNGTPSGYQVDLMRCPQCNGTKVVLPAFSKSKFFCTECAETIPTPKSLKTECEEYELKTYIDKKCKVCDKGELVFNEAEGYWQCPECDEIFKDEKVTTKEFVLKTDHSRVIHAEANALMFAARKGYSVEGATMYVTTSPCPNCSLLIAQAKIKEVVYKEIYRDTEGIELLKSLGVNVRKFKQTSSFLSRKDLNKLTKK